MSIKYYPDRMLKRLAPESKIKRLLRRGNISLKRTALSFVDDAEFISKRSVSKVALNVINSYKSRIEADEAVKSEILDDPKLLIQRVQNEFVFQVSKEIQSKYEGKRARWLPSDAEEPDPEHQRNYGKEYTIGEGIDGEEPGDRYGCKCGVEILVDETRLDLD